MKCVYYKKIVRKTGELVCVNYTWVNDVKKFLKDNSGNVFKTSEITKEEFDNLKN